MNKKIGPSGWSPDRIETRIDGFVSASGRVPDFIAKMMARRKKSINSIAAIRARMACRHRMMRRMMRLNND